MKTSNPVPIQHRLEYIGVKPNEPDDRDIVFGDLKEIFKADPNAPTYEQGFSVEDRFGVHLKREHQNGSYSCTCQATSKYLEMLNYIETKETKDLSAKFGYRQIYLPQGGAYIRDALKVAVNQGCCEETICPSYVNGEPPTEAYMRAGNIMQEMRDNALTFQSKKFVEMLNSGSNLKAKDWELLRQTIYQYHGFISGYSSHCMYAIGYGIKNGRKFIKFLNSYGEGSDQFYYGDVEIFNVCSLIDLPNPPKKIMALQLIKKRGSDQVCCVAFGKNYWIDDMAKVIQGQKEGLFSKNIKEQDAVDINGVWLDIPSVSVK